MNVPWAPEHHHLQSPEEMGDVPIRSILLCARLCANPLSHDATMQILSFLLPRIIVPYIWRIYAHGVPCNETNPPNGTGKIYDQLFDHELTRQQKVNMTEAILHA